MLPSTRMRPRADFNRCSSKGPAPSSFAMGWTSSATPFSTLSTPTSTALLARPHPPDSSSPLAVRTRTPRLRLRRRSSRSCATLLPTLSSCRRFVGQPTSPHWRSGSGRTSFAAATSRPGHSRTSYAAQSLATTGLATCGSSGPISSAVWSLRARPHLPFSRSVSATSRRRGKPWQLQKLGPRRVCRLVAPSRKRFVGKSIESSGAC
jgi:hypothetical protein